MRFYTISDWIAVKEKLAAGYSTRACAQETNVNRQTVFRWSNMKHPPDRLVISMHIDAFVPYTAKSNRYLTYEQRTYIAALLNTGFSKTDIAKEIGVHRTTISSELKRCKEGKYNPKIAHLDAAHKSRRPKPYKLNENLELRRYVISRLALKWSPEQVSKMLVKDYPDDRTMRVSAETIYQSIYIQGKTNLRHELGVEIALRSKRTKRKPQSRLPKRTRGNSWVHGCEISTRPAEVEDRAIPGHWEGDLIIGSDLKSCLVTLVERKTRFLIARRLLTHDTKTVIDLLIEMSEAIPNSMRDALVQSLTWDQGVEMADAARFTQATNFKVYFCDPHSPWQKGTNENTNGLIREYFPKGTSFIKVTDKEVLVMQDQLNSRPRKTLEWKTPAYALSVELINAKRATTG